MRSMFRLSWCMCGTVQRHVPRKCWRKHDGNVWSRSTCVVTLVIPLWVTWRIRLSGSAHVIVHLGVRVVALVLPALVVHRAALHRRCVDTDVAVDAALVTASRHGGFRICGSGDRCVMVHHGSCGIHGVGVGCVVSHHVAE